MCFCPGFPKCCTCSQIDWRCFLNLLAFCHLHVFSYKLSQPPYRSASVDSPYNTEWVQTCQLVSQNDIWPNSHTKLCKTLVQSSPRVWEGVLVSLQITYHKHRIWLNAVHTLCNEVFAGYSRPIGAAFVLLGADWLEWWACSAQPAGPVPRVLWSSASNSWNSADDMSHSHAHTHSCILSDTQTKCKHIGYIDTHIYILYSGCYCWTYDPVFLCVHLQPCDKWIHQFVIMMYKFLVVFPVKPIWKSEEVEPWLSACAFIVSTSSSSVWTYKKTLLVKKHVVFVS